MSANKTASLTGLAVDVLRVKVLIKSLTGASDWVWFQLVQPYGAVG